MKIISFSLWGNNPKYTIGAIINAQLASNIFPEWIVRFYYDDTVPNIIVDCLNNFKNVETVRVTDGSFGAFWRFRAMVSDTIVLSRDTDSRLSFREKHIVDNWLLSDSRLCTIRDHANHYEFPILAGMWGIKNGLDLNVANIIPNYSSTHAYLTDQIYLRDVVWPQYESQSVVYGLKETSWMRDSYSLIGKDFIGQTYDENNIPVYDSKL